MWLHIWLFVSSRVNHCLGNYREKWPLPIPLRIPIRIYSQGPIWVQDLSVGVMTLNRPCSLSVSFLESGVTYSLLIALSYKDQIRSCPWKHFVTGQACSLLIITAVHPVRPALFSLPYGRVLMWGDMVAQNSVMYHRLGVFLLYMHWGMDSW